MARPWFGAPRVDQSNATAAGRVTLGSTAGLSLVGTNTLNNGAIGDTTQALKIVPYLIGDVTTAGNGGNFLTYDSTLGMRVLTTAEQTVLTAGYTTAANHDNVIGDAVTLTAGSVAVNSLLMNTPVTLNGTSTALTVDSGAVAATANGAIIGSGITSLASVAARESSRPPPVTLSRSTPRSASPAAVV